MSKNVVIFASINMDFSIACKELPKQGQTITGEDFMLTQGGKGANQAIAAAKLGAKVKVIGCVGDDEFAPSLLASLQTWQIDTSYVQQIPNIQSGAAIILRTNSDNRIIINHGANYHLKDKDVTALLSQMHSLRQIQPGDIFIAQFECDEKATEACLKTAKQLGLFTIFNTAPAKALKDFTNIDLLVLNQQENEFYTQIDIQNANMNNIKASIEKLKSQNAQNIIITLGSQGCVYYDQKELYKFEAFKVNPIDTTAAGDTFIGALAANLAANNDMFAAIKQASKAAAISTLSIGAASSAPTLEQLNTFKG